MSRDTATGGSTNSQMLAPIKESWPLVDYVEELARRQQRLFHLRSNPNLIIGAKEYYRTRPLDFIQHWGIVLEPRAAGSGPQSATLLPFVMFKRQRELVEFVMALLKEGEPGLVEKSRDMGATWTCVWLSIWLFLFWPGAVVGWGSYLARFVDQIGNPDSILEKIRIGLRNLPPEFYPIGFSLSDNMVSMRITNPETNAAILGAIGDNIGRGGRTLIYFKDESAHYEHAELIEASLSNNSLVQVDISSVYGLNTVFQRRREAGADWSPGLEIPKGRTRVFVMDWRDHPAKTQEWYDRERKRKEDEGLLHIWAQEVDRDYAASVSGVIIPATWVRAAIDAHITLKFADDGGYCAGLDVADEGGDTNALAIRKGVILKSVDEWGERDTGVTTRRAIAACRPFTPLDLQYDSVSVGAGVKAEANRLGDEKSLPSGLRLVPWNAGAEVQDKEKHLIPGDRNSPKNEDFYANMKAQAWWNLRLRFEKTYRAVNGEPGFTWNADDLVSIPSGLPLLHKIVKELSQATMGHSSKLKLLINKQPDGAKSPNLADAIVMCFWPAKKQSIVRGFDANFMRQLAAMPPRKPMLGMVRR